MDAAPDFLPRLWVPHDAADGLRWWLQNPLLLHHYPQRMAATTAHAATLTANADKLALVWKLRQERWRCATQKAVPQGLPQMSWVAFHAVCARIEDRGQRQQVLSFARRHAGCEMPWLADRIEAVLAAQLLAA